MIFNTDYGWIGWEHLPEQYKRLRQQAVITKDGHYDQRYDSSGKLIRLERMMHTKVEENWNCNLPLHMGLDQCSL